MKRIALFLFLAVAVRAATDVTLFGWQESRDEKTGEKQFCFLLAPAAVKKVFDADVKGAPKQVEAAAAKLPKNAWMYGLLLSGESTAYSEKKIALFEPSPCGIELELVSGSVDIDRKSETVRVALKVKQDGKVVDFIGNGVYRIKLPNQSARPNAHRTSFSTHDDRA